MRPTRGYIITHLAVRDNDTRCNGIRVNIGRYLQCLVSWNVAVSCDYIYAQMHCRQAMVIASFTYSH